MERITSFSVDHRKLTKGVYVSRIEGEYAYLKRTDIESEEELFIAMALLPLGVDIGTKLHYECMEYSII